MAPEVYNVDLTQKNAPIQKVRQNLRWCFKTLIYILIRLY